METMISEQRKSPKQARSVAIVESIYGAVLKLLPTFGSSTITTNKVAETAGVSIGSLYRYFPNKKTLLAAVLDLIMRSQAEKTRQALLDCHGKPFDELVRIMVRAVLELYLGDKENIRELFPRTSELGRLSFAIKIRRYFIGLAATEIEQHLPGLSKAEYQRISFIVAYSFVGILEGLMVDNSIDYSIDELTDEIQLLIVSYFESKKRRIEKEPQIA